MLSTSARNAIFGCDLFVTILEEALWVLDSNCSGVAVVWKKPRFDFHSPPIIPTLTPLQLDKEINIYSV